MTELNKIVYSKMAIWNVGNIEINDGGCGNRKVVVDEKEVDLSKVKSIDIHFDCDGIKLDAELIGAKIELPYKEL